MLPARLFPAAFVPAAPLVPVVDAPFPSSDDAPLVSDEVPFGKSDEAVEDSELVVEVPVLVAVVAGAAVVVWVACVA